MLQQCVNLDQRLSATLARWRGVMSIRDSGHVVAQPSRRSDRRAPACLSGTVCCNHLGTAAALCGCEVAVEWHELPTQVGMTP
jgi:hypothetical protein